MKVKFEITLDISAADWASNYGLDPKDAKAIRDDIRGYLPEVIYNQLDNAGVGYLR